MGELRNDPALAGKVDWQAVETRFEQWDYKEQGLTEAGAALVTLVATALTAGSGGLTASLSSSLAASLGVAGNVALEAALQAGVQALINKTAVALVNNRGNLGGALEELGSSATLRSLVTSMVTAGLTAHLMDVSGIGANLDPQAPLADRIVQDLQRGLIRASVTAGVEAAVNGQPLGDALISALRQQAALVLGETLAEEIGAAVHEGGMQRLPQLIAHAAVGCLTGSVATGDCKGGAAGAVAGELTADAISAMIEDDLREAFAKGTLSEAEAEHMVLEWRESGVNVARLAGGLAAALAGGDVDTGADAGGNAAENNAFWIPVIAVIVIALEVTDKVLVAKDAVDISMAVYACNGGDTAACSQAEEMAKQAAIDAGIELSIGSIVPGSKAGADLIRWVRKNADADTLRAIDRAADANRGPDVSSSIGAPAGYPALARPGANAPAHTVLGELDEIGRPTGVTATLNPAVLGTGTPASSSILPPGFAGQSANHARGHLLARMLGGAGNDARNLVTLFQRNANHPNMSSFERQVYAAVSNGETVNFRVIPIYSGANPMPVGVTLTARGANGFNLDVSIPNINGVK